MTMKMSYSRLVLAFLVAAASVFVPWLARAADTVPASREQVTLTFAPLVKKAAPAVVNIYTRRVVRTRHAASRRPDLPPVLRRQSGDAARAGERSLGSGVLVRPDGVVVTNDHVIKDSDEITVVLADRREFEAKILRRRRAHRPGGPQDRSGRRGVAGLAARRFRCARSGRRGAGHRQPLRCRPDGDDGHRLGAGAHRDRRRRITASSSRPTRRSTRAIPAAR